ncbi:MAG: ATP-dependent DNA helicase RecG [Alphaproteobacteria bacterium]|jgi:ATP-dependent DNA helicase RecG|nr:ATP-dependent DNA helicase RecG [Alphaproteobacteria bacterium]
MRDSILNPLFVSVETLPGIGSKTSLYIKKLLGNDRLKDLLFLKPSNVIDRTFSPKIKDVIEGQICTLEVEIISHDPNDRYRKVYSVFCKDETGFISVKFFKPRKDWIKSQLPVGEKRVISGTIEKFNNSLQMTHPDFIEKVENKYKVQKVEAVYPLTAGLSRKMIGKAIDKCLDKVPDLAEWNNEHFMAKQKWLSWKESILKLHSPTSKEDIIDNSLFKDRLAYDEVLSMQLALAYVRKFSKEKKGISIGQGGEGLDFKSTKAPLPNPLLQGESQREQAQRKKFDLERGNVLQKLIQDLPFSLTGAQERAIKNIFIDMKSPHKMMRLLQGDVGSGKTIVSLFACINACSSGFQSCIMAPTEILATQHYETINKFCKNLNIEVEILTGKHKGKNREEKLHKINNGEAKIIIGTHALFQESVEFYNLGLAVIDEQHRFGVHQRMMLAEKGEKLDCLVMSATPIPRTLTLTLYGDMDISILDEKPANRKDINTVVINSNKLDDVVNSLQDKINEGEQIYWVCPLVEESEKIDLAAATDRYNNLKKIFGDKVGLIHGKMKADEKKHAMDKFSKGITRILVATTVIEVGVDVKNASIMIIEHSERFGLSQLHQLRGRVGRGEKQSTCILIYSHPISIDGRKRLEIMRKTNDGFLIAEEDLSIRGGGEILGTRQSGIPEFKFADYSIHKDLFMIARQDAKVIIETDPYLKSERGQALRILLYLFEQDVGIKYLEN